jgi:hypothetical protein
MSALLTGWRVSRYERRRDSERRTDRRMQEHIERLEKGIKDSPRGPGAMM